MSITVEWDNLEQTMIRLTVSPGWTWADFDAGVDQTFALLHTVHHKVVVLVCAPHEDSMRVPTNAAIYWWRFLRTRWKGHHYIVFVNLRPYGKAIYHMFARVIPSLPNHMFFASTLDEARQIAAERLAVHETL